MSILIKGMKMPIIKDNTGMKMEICKIGGKTEIGIKDGLPHCSEQWHYYEVVEVPEPHGRLIDASKLETDGGGEWNGGGFSKETYSKSVIADAPTVIEAEGEDNERID